MRFGTLPAVFLVEEYGTDVVRVRREGQRMGIFGQQVEQTLAVGMAEGFRIGVGVEELDVSGEDHQVVLGNETKVVLR